MIPKIEFRHSRIYDEMIFWQNKEIKEFLKKQKKEYPSQREIHQYIDKIGRLWEKDGKKILRNIRSVTGLKWKEKKIIVYIVGYCRPFSDPLTIKPYKDKNYFIDVLTHELIHQIQSQNNKNWNRWFKHLSEKYPEESRITRRHILLNSVHWILITKMWNKSHLNKIIKKHSKDKDYEKAWEIVKMETPEKIINEFREITK